MLKAVIREIDCIGCARCLPSCPVDAIIGAPGLLHSILADECIGCKLCLAPCPMDCIEMIPVTLTANEKAQLAQIAKKRYQAKQRRLQTKKLLPLQDKQSNQIRQEINDAIQRVRNKNATK